MRAGLDAQSDVLLGLYRLAFELPAGDFQDAALALVKPWVRFDSCMWGHGQTGETGVVPHAVHLHDKSPQMLVEYAALQHLDAAAQSMLRVPAATRGFDSRECFGASHQRDYLDFLRRFEHAQIAISSVYDPGTNLSHWVSLYRADADRRFVDDDLGRLSWLTPHLLQALQQNRVRHHPFVALEDACGTAICDAQGCLIFSDARFRELLAAEWGTRPVVKMPGPAWAAFAAGRSAFLGGAVLIRSLADQGLLMLTARPRCAADRLTEREMAVARRVAKGLTYREIATELHRAPATVRNHIQAIYEKLGVSNIVGLIAALALADRASRL